jgi:prepilin-type N-terminal cleavage/methylation domain-containing protein
VIGTTRATLSSAMSIPLARLIASAHSNERGFTLLELMIALAIVTTVSALAIPNYLVWNRTYQLRQATTELQGNLNLARMTAMNRNTSVTMTLGPILCPPDTAYCGINGVSFGGILSPLPLASGKIIGNLTTGGSTVQLSSLGLRIGGPVGNQLITLTNTDNLTYSIVITPGGKIRWCPANTCS